MLDLSALVLALALGSPRPDHLPHPWLTPGAVVPGVTAADVCAPGYAGKARHVTPGMKWLVFRRYGIDSARSAGFEVDHLISLELGGANVVENLFPEPWTSVVGGRDMGAHSKDRAENATHRAVCVGKISLAEAQRQMAKDWTVLYRRFVSPEFPKAK